MNKSAGILLYRNINGYTEVFLVHPGGPFWKGKDKGAWSLPKGLIEEGEDPLSAAIREFKEETGTLLSGQFIELIPVKQKGGKTVVAWMLEGDIDIDSIVSNNFIMEWPYKSGKRVSFPEVDQAAWFTIPEALIRINSAQASFILQLQEKTSMVS